MLHAHDQAAAHHLRKHQRARRTGHQRLGAWRGAIQARQGFIDLRLERLLLHFLVGVVVKTGRGAARGEGGRASSQHGSGGKAGESGGFVHDVRP